MSRIDEAAHRECRINAVGIAVSHTEAEKVGLSSGYANTSNVYLTCHLQGQFPYL